MLNRLKGILQRVANHLGMTEVQTVEPQEPQGAVPGAPETAAGASNATGAEPTPSRRLKRTGEEWDLGYAARHPRLA